MIQVLLGCLQTFVQSLLQFTRGVVFEDTELVHHLHVTAHLHEHKALIEFLPFLFTQLALCGSEAAIMNLVLDLYELLGNAPIMTRGLNGDVATGGVYSNIGASGRIRRVFAALGSRSFVFVGAIRLGGVSAVGRVAIGRVGSCRSFCAAGFGACGGGAWSSSLLLVESIQLGQEIGVIFNHLLCKGFDFWIGGSLLSKLRDRNFALVVRSETGHQEPFNLW
jgi:hypothetical protein